MLYFLFSLLSSHSLQIILMPVTAALNPLLEFGPFAGSWEWMDQSLLRTLDAQAAFFSHSTLHLLLPMAYFYLETPGLPTMSRVRHALLNYLLVASLSLVLLYVLASWIGVSTGGSFLGVADAWTGVIVGLLSLRTLPRGSSSLFTYLHRMPVHPWYRKAATLRLAELGFEEAVCRRKYDRAMHQLYSPSPPYSLYSPSSSSSSFASSASSFSSLSPDPPSPSSLLSRMSTKSMDDTGDYHLDPHTIPVTATTTTTTATSSRRRGSTLNLSEGGDLLPNDLSSPYHSLHRRRLPRRGLRHCPKITPEKVRELGARWRRVHQAKMSAQKDMDVSPLRRNASFLSLSLLAFIAWIGLMARVALALVAGFAGDEEEEDVEAWVLDQLQSPHPLLFTGIRALITLYFLLIFTLGLWESPRFRSLRPRPGHTSMRAIVGCVLLTAIASRGLTICGGILGLGRDVIEGWEGGGGEKEDVDFMISSFVPTESLNFLSVLTGADHGSTHTSTLSGDHSSWGKGWIEALYRVGVLVGVSYSILDLTLLSRFHTPIPHPDEEEHAMVGKGIKGQKLPSSSSSSAPMILNEGGGDGTSHLRMGRRPSLLSPLDDPSINSSPSLSPSPSTSGRTDHP